MTLASSNIGVANHGRDEDLGITDFTVAASDLRLAGVRAYAADQPFQLRQYRWDKRVLVVSATTSDDQDLQAQQQAIASTRDAFESRHMVLVTLLDSALASAGDRTLTAAEVSTARAALGITRDEFALRLIGKDGSVKLARDTATPMSEIYALIDTMPMRRAETRRN